MDKYEEYRHFYINNGLAEKNFYDREQKQAHQSEWEVIIAGYLQQNGVDLKRSKLDFLGKSKGITFNIEATAPQEGNGCNKVKDVPCDSGSFEDCIRDDNKIMLRFHSCLAEKLKQITKKDFEKDAIILLAINGYECVKGWEFIFDKHPFIVRCLFGLGNLCVDSKGMLLFDESTTYRKAHKTFNLPALFRNPQNPIAGVIYSVVTRNTIRYRNLTKEDFLYIKNPYKQDLSDIFQDYMCIYK